MSSTAQVLANRQNAAHSTGPKSPEGKAASSKNATRHGLSGTFAVLQHESQDDFDQLGARLLKEFQPEGENEQFLVEQMIQARWKMLRLERLEAAAFEQILTEPGSSADPDACILAALSKPGNPIERLQRYAAASERSYFKALRELQTSRLRAGRIQQKAIDNYIKQVVYAPMPGSTSPNSAGPVPNSQNEPDRRSAQTTKAGSLGNLALRL